MKQTVFDYHYDYPSAPPSPVDPQTVKQAIVESFKEMDIEISDWFYYDETDLNELVDDMMVEMSSLLLSRPITSYDIFDALVQVTSPFGSFWDSGDELEDKEFEDRVLNAFRSTPNRINETFEHMKKEWEEEWNITIEQYHEMLAQRPNYNPFSKIIGEMIKQRKDL